MPFVGYERFVIRLTASEREIVTREIVGNGGHQRLLAECARQLGDDGDVLVLDGRTIDTMSRYAYAYGGGGYQVRFRALVAAARRAGWSAP